MAHTKGWSASTAIKSDVSGAQVHNVRRVGSLAETSEVMHMVLFIEKGVLHVELYNF